MSVDREPIHIGFTGTRKGMTEWQRQEVGKLIITASVTSAGIVAHHGDCIGADGQFHREAVNRGAHVVIHPGNVPSMRANCDAQHERAPKPFMARNADMMAESDVMIATPHEGSEAEYMHGGRRGGTWATIRMARRANKPLIIIWPDGTTEGSWT